MILKNNDKNKKRQEVKKKTNRNAETKTNRRIKIQFEIKPETWVNTSQQEQHRCNYKGRFQ